MIVSSIPNNEKENVTDEELLSLGRLGPTDPFPGDRAAGLRAVWDESRRRALVDAAKVAENERVVWEGGEGSVAANAITTRIRALAHPTEDRTNADSERSEPWPQPRRCHKASGQGHLFAVPSSDSAGPPMTTPQDDAVEVRARSIFQRQADSYGYESLTWESAALNRDEFRHRARLELEREGTTP